MRWTILLVAETEPGKRVEQPLCSIERDQHVSLAHLGLTLAEGKRFLRAAQRQMVQAQVTRHGTVYRRCGHCRRKLATKGYQRQWFRSAFGRVPIRVRRLTTCRCQGEPRTTFSSLPVSGQHGLVAPEWLYLHAKLASLIPFARVADLLADVLPADEELNAETVRARVGRVGRRLEEEKEQQWVGRPRPTRLEARVAYPYSRRRHLDTTVGLDCAMCATDTRARNGTSRWLRVGRGRQAGPLAASPSSEIAPAYVHTTCRTRSLLSEAT